ncbi:MAG: glycosyltransferase family 39 protein [Candidatus Melainabacteria bacterium]|nr:glycosyltransferase family 39 protein [Candidatus Melainabacteria bacterium]
MPAVERELETRSGSCCGSGKSKPEPGSALLVPASILLAALLIRLWFSLLDGHQVIAWSCDAYEYLQYAGSLGELLRQTPRTFLDCLGVLAGIADSSTRQAVAALMAPLAEPVSRGGPLFPLFLAAAFAVSGAPAGVDNLVAPVLAQALLSSLTCVFIAMTASRLFGKRAGVAAGALAALYPGFIVNSLRFYSESFATFFVSLILALTVLLLGEKDSRRSVMLGLMLGASLAFAQITRSVLVLVDPLVLLVLLFAGARTGTMGNVLRRTIPAIVGGLALVILPCLALQSLATGGANPVPNRLVHFNLFVGLDVNAQGYLSFPYPDGRGIEEKSLPQIIAMRASESPGRFAQLLSGKPVRLLKAPWNDFRTPVGIFGYDAQVLFHQICLLLGAAGVLLGLFYQGRLAGKVFLVAVLAAHGAYFFFDTIPRYALTAMPVVLVFAGAGSALLLDRRALPAMVSGALALAVCRSNLEAALIELAHPGLDLALLFATGFRALLFGVFLYFLWRSASSLCRLSMRRRLVLAFFSMVFMLFACLPLRAHGRPGEFETAVTGGSPASQTIALPAQPGRRAFFLLFDCRDWKTLGQDARVSVNGTLLDSPAVPLLPFLQNLDSPLVDGSGRLTYEAEHICLAVQSVAGGADLDMRQWFMMPVPAELVARAGDRLEVELRRNRHRPGVLFGGFKSRPDRARIPSVARFSWDKAFYGVESDSGFSDSRFDETIAVAPGRAERELNIRLLAFPLSNDPVSTDPGTRAGAPPSPDLSASLELACPRQFSRDTIWAVRVKALVENRSVEAVQAPVNFSVQVGQQTSRYSTGFVPTSLDLEPGANRVDFAFPVKPSAFPSRPDKVRLDLTYGGLAAGNQFFGVRGRGGDDLSVRALEVSVSPLPVQPFARSYEVF